MKPVPRGLRGDVSPVDVSPVDAAPPYARPFVVLFLATLVVCALAPFNLWPFSNWELFSRLRTDRQTGWQAVAVEQSDQVRDDPIASTPGGYRGFSFILAGFPTRSAASRNAICETWLHSATTRFGPETRVVRIYRTEWLLSDRHGSRAAAPHRRLAWTCTTRGAREA
jgi:hypothetical protein